MSKNRELQVVNIITEFNNEHDYELDDLEGDIVLNSFDNNGLLIHSINIVNVELLCFLRAMVEILLDVFSLKNTIYIRELDCNGNYIKASLLPKDILNIFYNDKSITLSFGSIYTDTIESSKEIVELIQQFNRIHHSSNDLNKNIVWLNYMLIKLESCFDIRKKLIDISHRDNFSRERYCVVCGYFKFELHSRLKTMIAPIIDACPCCNCLYNIEDLLPSEVHALREVWVKKGAKFLSKELEPQNWNAKDQLDVIHRLKL